MHRDGRFNPLEVIAQGVALFTVLGTALVHWLRHERPAETPPHTFREVREVTGPRPFYYRKAS